jgi:class 3 adenylate cyclase
VTSSPVKRKLAAILSADAVGYSRHMGDDEEQALRVLSAHRAVVDSVIEFHDGRIVNTAGDSVLAEFASPVQAVRAAVEIQDALKTRNESLPEGRRMLFRIGVNLGDVMIKDGDLLGDGVNIAARLQSIADPGGICVSSSIADQIEGKLNLRLESMGEPEMKNIGRPIRVFRIGTGVPRPADSARPSATRRGQGRPWAVAGAVIALAVGVTGGWMLYAHLTPDAPEASSPAQLAADAERAANERLRRELEEAAAAQRAAGERLQREMDEVAAARAANERRQREAEAAEAERARAERLRQDDAAAAAQRATSELARRELEAATAALRAASEAAKRDIAPPATAPERLAALTPPPITRFDGTWRGDYRCSALRQNPPLAATRAISVQNGLVVFEGGTPDTPGWHRAEGRVRDDGQVVMSGRGISNVPDNLGNVFTSSFTGRFTGDRFQGEGRAGGRDCAFDLKREAALTPPPLNRFDGVWRGDYRCAQLRQNPAFSSPRSMSVENGVVVFQSGTPGTPGWYRAEGRIRDDGQVVLLGKGISPLADALGTEYALSLSGRFNGDRFQAEGKSGPRDCALDLKHAER